MYNFNEQNNKVYNDIELINLMDLYYKDFLPFLYHKRIKKIYRVQFKLFPNLQKAGIDVAVKFDDDSIVKIEEKFRYIHRNDILLETWSNYESNIPGWSLDDTKQSDLVFYVNNFIHVFNYKKLRKLYKYMQPIWRQEYGQIITENESYGNFYTTIGTPIPIELLKDIHYCNNKKYRNLI